MSKFSGCGGVKNPPHPEEKIFFDVDGGLGWCVVGTNQTTFTLSVLLSKIVRFW